MFISVGIIHGEAQLAEQTISQGFVIWGKIGKRKGRVVGKDLQDSLVHLNGSTCFVNPHIHNIGPNLH